MKQSWFYRKSSIKKLYISALIILGVILFIEYFIILHTHFSIEKIFGFHAVFGFLSCIGLIIFAKLLGFLVKRKDDYYDM